MKKQAIEFEEDIERIKEFSVRPITVSFNKPRIKTSSSCKVIVRLPSVEPEEKFFKINKKPLRPSSAPRLNRKRRESKGEEKNDEMRKVKKSEKCRNWLDSYKDISSVFGLHGQKIVHLPDPHIMEYKRASLRLRKLKRVTLRKDKENSLNN